MERLPVLSTLSPCGLKMLGSADLERLLSFKLMVECFQLAHQSIVALT